VNVEKYFHEHWRKWQGRVGGGAVGGVAQRASYLGQAHASYFYAWHDVFKHFNIHDDDDDAEEEEHEEEEQGEGASGAWVTAVSCVLLIVCALTSLDPCVSYARLQPSVAAHHLSPAIEFSQNSHPPLSPLF